MYLRLQHGPSLGPLVAVSLFTLAALSTGADARPAKRNSYGVAAFGDTEFAPLHMRAAYASRRSVTRPQVTRVAALDMSTKSAPSSSLISEARRWIGTNPTGQRSLWCGHFMNFVLGRTGHRAHNSNLARSFASYGRPVSGPQVGAIAVMSRGPHGGHVGIVTDVDASGNPIVISGNVNKRVEEIPYPRGRILAYVMP
jgi:uncharacterized protein (TIGR02594 family)